jgi:hypothetical protein
MKKRALLVGINYSNNPDIGLKNCVNDVVKVRDLLVSKYNYNFSDIVILRDNFSDMETICEKKLPTKANILRHLESMIKHSASSMELWIYYSGHGSEINPLPEKDEILPRVIVPYDYHLNGFITENELYNIIKQTQCPTLVMTDICHSGALCDLQYRMEFLYDDAFHTIDNPDLAINDSKIFMMSGYKDQEEPSNSFTDTLLNVLKSHGYRATLQTVFRDMTRYIQRQHLEYLHKPCLSSSSKRLSWFFGDATIFINQHKRNSMIELRNIVDNECDSDSDNGIGNLNHTRNSCIFFLV